MEIPLSDIDIFKSQASFGEEAQQVDVNPGSIRTIGFAREIGDRGNELGRTLVELCGGQKAFEEMMVKSNFIKVSSGTVPLLDQVHLVFSIGELWAIERFYNGIHNP